MAHKFQVTVVASLILLMEKKKNDSLYRKRHCVGYSLYG